MKFVLVLAFLVSTLVAISTRQFHQQRNGQLWWARPPTTESSFYYDPVDADTPFFRYSKPIHIIYSSQDDEESNGHQELFGRKQFYMENNRDSADDEPKSQNNLFFQLEQLLGRQSEKERKSGLVIPVVSHQSSNNRYLTNTNSNQMAAEAMPRIKNYGPVRDLSTNQDQNARFFYIDGSNFLSKTVTISVTSTCTSISIISCIPLTSLDPNAPPVNCRRKRAVEIHQTDDNDDDSQFQVIPTEVQTVTQTVEPTLPLTRSSAVEMISSKEEIDNNNNVGSSAAEIDNQLMRKGRVFKFNFQSFLTYTTITILKSIVTSTLTQTYLPAAALACLPAGYSICPV